MTSAPPIGFEYRRSRLLMLALAGIAILAIIGVLNAGMPPHWRGLLSLLIAVAVGVRLRQLGRPRVDALLWQADGSVQVKLRGHRGKPERQVHAELRKSFVLGPLITLDLRWPHRGHARLWLLPDNLDGDIRRRLRVRLRSRH